MDEEVFSKKEVGDFYNEHFISVRCQMDKTSNDDKVIKSWYKEADKFKKEYGIPVFPTYLFFSPDGELVSRDQGFQRENEFIASAKKSVNPANHGRFLRYYYLLTEYQKGKKNYKLLPALIDTAKQLRQDDVVTELETAYRVYLSGLTEKELYTKENLSFISSIVQNSKDTFFRLFYPNCQRVDSVMTKKGFANSVVDKLIFKEEILPLLKLYAKAHKDDPPIVAVQSNPDWHQYIRNITSRYDSDFANRTVLWAQVWWYEKLHDYAMCAKYFTTLVNNYSLDNYDADLDLWLNTFIIWNAISKRSVDKEQVDVAIKCMEGVVKRVKVRGGYPGIYLDTYANLLYKAGRVKEATAIEEEAVEMAIKWKQPDSDIQEMRDTLAKMKDGKSIWPNYIDKSDIF